MPASEIRLGTNGPRFGTITVDPAAIRGEGGWQDPRLVVPLEVTLETQPHDHMIAITQLNASLSLHQYPSASNRIGPEARVDLSQGFYTRSSPNGPSESRPEARFHLAQQQAQLLEDARHAASDNRLTLYIHLDAHIVWLRHTGNSGAFFPGEESTLGEGGWDTGVGMFSETLPFWNPSVGDLQLQIEPSVWVHRVLPGLGYDRVRLVEFGFADLPGEGVVIAQFDKARRKYDAGDYPGCVQGCRGIHKAWERALNATSKQHLADKLADLHQWPSDDWHRTMLDRLWESYVIMVNALHHPENSPLPATAADARLCLLLTAVLSEYIERLRKQVAPPV